MAFDQILSAANISASGLTAERTRMEVVANNIANAFSTRGANGGPFRRQDVLFATVLDDQLRQGRGGPRNLNGVQVLGVVDDSSDFPMIFNPGHPDANGDGYVAMPNVSLPLEMVNLITANRAYEANLKVLQAFRQQADQILTLLRA
jgi:flagellar basal-body rod protein FlgC